MSKVRVLLVDVDTSENRRKANLLTRQRFKVDLAVSAADALRCAERKRFDAFVVSSELSDLSGYELCLQLRQAQDHAAVMIQSKTEWRETFKYCSDAVLPYSPASDQLITTIKEAITRKTGRTPTVAVATPARNILAFALDRSWRMLPARMSPIRICNHLNGLVRRHNDMAKSRDASRA